MPPSDALLMHTRQKGYNLYTGYPSAMYVIYSVRSGSGNL